MTAADRLSQLEIDTTQPGFYDDPEFIEQERRDPAFLEVYAQFVEERTRDEYYDEYTRKAVRHVAEFLYERLKQDGRLGACVDASMVISRFLERLGVWNYCAKGGLTIEFNDTHSPIYYAPIGGRSDKSAGHGWVVAPPFRVVDVTVERQPYTNPIRRRLPKFILSENAESTTASIKDWIDPEDYLRMTIHLRREPTLEDLPQDMVAKAEKLGIWLVRWRSVRLKYLTPGVGGPDKPLERIRSLCLSGRTPIQLWGDFLKAHPEYAAGQS